ncbi:MAG: PHB depolymerase family esterase [Elusimicrobiota bacterium]|nr:PHB depolymerase family esterase [Elusimicrobiota bacterium]
MTKKSTILTAITLSAVILFGAAQSHCESYKAGDYWKKLEFGGRTRTYLLHIPASFNGKKAVPLVIVLHGGGGNASKTVETTGFSKKSDEAGFIVVYPNGTGRLKKILTWNAGNCCGYALDNNVDDVGFIRELINQIEKELKIDGRRIYATGISNGGMMAYRLACELSDKIAAIAPVAGAFNIDTTPKNPVSVMIFHGTADQHVLYEGGEPKKRADRRSRTDKSVAFAADFWVNHNGCSAKPNRTEKGNIIMEKYTGGRKNSEVVLVTIKNGEHAWPGGKPAWRGGDIPTTEISATDEMWNFFEKHPKETD